MTLGSRMTLGSSLLRVPKVVYKFSEFRSSNSTEQRLQRKVLERTTNGSPQYISQWRHSLLLKS